MKRYFIIIIIILFAIVSFLLMECSSMPDGRTVIKYMRWGDASEVNSTRELITLFEKENPGIKIDFSSESWGVYWEKLLTQIAGNNAPDVFLIGASYIQDFYNSDALLNLQELIDNDQEIDLNDFFDPPKEIFTFDNNLYGIPRDINSIVLYYNKNLFDRASVPYPNSKWKWNDLVEAGKKLVFDEDNDGIPDIWGLETVNDYEVGWGNLIYQNGGEIINKSRTKCVLNNIPVIEALQFFSDLQNLYHISPKSGQRASLGADAFVTGKIAMSINGSWRMGYYSDSIDSFDWDIEELPAGKAKATIANGVGHVIFKKSKHPIEAWEFVKFLSGESAQIALAKSGTAIPILKKVAMSSNYLNGKPENKKAAIDSIKFGRNYPITAKMGEWLYTCVIPQIDYILLGKKTARSAMEEAAKQVNAVLDENQ